MNTAHSLKCVQFMRWRLQGSCRRKKEGKKRRMKEWKEEKETKISDRKRDSKIERKKERNKGRIKEWKGKINKQETTRRETVR